MKRTGFKRLCLLAGIAALGTVAGAYFYDATIKIDRALNSPTLTVRYSGASATVVELRINGVSVATRNVSSGKNAGETNFTLDLSMLSDGDNEVEIRLLNKAGKVVGTERSVISTDAGTKGPVFLSVPKMGATVQGPVEIKLGFGRDMKNVYVSFFIDNQFKSMMNVPPYNYVWDTAREVNGWHEVEAWVVDSTSTTFKTRKVKVFVNNPGGNTNRTNPDDDIEPVKTKEKSTNPGKTIDNPDKTVGTVGSDDRIKETKVGSSSPVNGSTKLTQPKATGVVSEGEWNVQVGNPASMKNVIANTISMGPKFLTPTGTRVVYSKKSTGVTSIAKTTKTVTSATSLIKIGYGQRLNNVASFSVLLNSKFVDFDVAPRVTNGVPLTPFRHLLEQAGGVVNWDNGSKIIDAKADGRLIWIKIGENWARVNDEKVKLELAPFIENGRTIVPLSFIKDSLDVNVEYDPATGHVLITSKK